MHGKETPGPHFLWDLGRRHRAESRHSAFPWCPAPRSGCDARVTINCALQQHAGVACYQPACCVSGTPPLRDHPRWLTIVDNDPVVLAEIAGSGLPGPLVQLRGHRLSLGPVVPCRRTVPRGHDSLVVIGVVVCLETAVIDPVERHAIGIPGRGAAPRSRPGSEPEGGRSTNRYIGQLPELRPPSSSSGRACACNGISSTTTDAIVMAFRHDRGRVVRAAAVCATCLVREPCGEVGRRQHDGTWASEPGSRCGFNEPGTFDGGNWEVVT
jgi:hypothetical protein